MFKFGIYLIVALLAWNLYEESEAESQDVPQFRCLLRDPENQCAGFCFSRLKRLISHLALHEQEWSLRDAFTLNATQERLDRMELQQAKIESGLANIQAALDMIRESQQP
ncbi:hypothetical protein KR059_004324 [Drosophila kikkawai]|nr:hypothetical protein KR059_004324 [Drosophila kikkawai]